MVADLLLRLRSSSEKQECLGSDLPHLGAHELCSSNATAEVCAISLNLAASHYMSAALETFGVRWCDDFIFADSTDLAGDLEQVLREVFKVRRIRFSRRLWSSCTERCGANFRLDARSSNGRSFWVRRQETA